MFDIFLFITYIDFLVYLFSFLFYDGYLGRTTANIGEKDWPWIAHIYPTIALTIGKTLWS